MSPHKLPQPLRRCQKDFLQEIAIQLYRCSSESSVPCHETGVHEARSGVSLADSLILPLPNPNSPNLPLLVEAQGKNNCLTYQTDPIQLRSNISELWNNYCIVLLGIPVECPTLQVLKWASILLPVVQRIVPGGKRSLGFSNYVNIFAVHK